MVAMGQIEKLSRFFGTDMDYVLKSGLWLNGNFVLNLILGVISSILFANFVSKDAYGTYQFILAIAAALAVIVPNNMSTAVARAVAQGSEGDLIKATIFQIRWGLVSSVVAIGISIWYIFHQNLGLSLSLLIVAVFMPTTFALNTWGAYLQGRKNYKRYFFYTSIATFISYGGIFATIFIKPEFFWLALANIVFAFVANLILYFLTIRKTPPNNQTNPGTIPYGVHLSLMGIPQGLAGQLDALLVFHYLGAAALAVYSFATILPEKLTGGLKFIPIMALPKFSQQSEVDVKNFFTRKIWFLIGFLALVAAAYAFIAPYLFRWIFPKYLQSIPYTQVYALSFFSVAGGVAQSALVSQQKTRQLYKLNLATPIVKISLLIVLGLLFGIWGIIWAQIITVFFQIFFPIFLLR